MYRYIVTLPQICSLPYFCSSLLSILYLLIDMIEILVHHNHVVTLLQFLYGYSVRTYSHFIYYFQLQNFCLGWELRSINSRLRLSAFIDSNPSPSKDEHSEERIWNFDQWHLKQQVAWIMASRHLYPGNPVGCGEKPRGRRNGKNPHHSTTCHLATPFHKNSTRKKPTR